MQTTRSRARPSRTAAASQRRCLGHLSKALLQASLDNDLAEQYVPNRLIGMQTFRPFPRLGVRLRASLDAQYLARLSRAGDGPSNRLAQRSRACDELRIGLGVLA